MERDEEQRAQEQGTAPQQEQGTAPQQEQGAAPGVAMPGGKTLSSAPNTSFEGWSGSPGFDSPPAEASLPLSNQEVEGADHARPYYPSGGAPDGGLTEEEGGERP